MAEITYMIKVKMEKEPHDSYEDIQQVLYDMGATDVDLLEVYED